MDDIIRDRAGDDRPHGAGGFQIEILNSAFEASRVAIDDQKIVGGQIVELAGKRPVEDYSVLLHLKTGELESVRPTEVVDLQAKGAERFFVIKGDRLLRFTVEGLVMEWPGTSLKAWQIKFLARAGEDDQLVLDRDDGDKVLQDEDVVSFSDAEVERLRLRRAPKTVTVTYDETRFELERRIYTTQELIAIFKVPDGYILDLVVPGDLRELKPGEHLKVRDGMEFTSHPPRGQSS